MKNLKFSTGFILAFLFASASTVIAGGFSAGFSTGGAGISDGSTFTAAAGTYDLAFSPGVSICEDSTSCAGAGLLLDGGVAELFTAGGLLDISAAGNVNISSGKYFQASILRSHTSGAGVLFTFEDGGGTDSITLSDGGTWTPTDGTMNVTGAAFIDGAADTVQLLVQGNATQTALPLVVENSAGADQFTVSNGGAVVATGRVTAGTTVSNGVASQFILTDNIVGYTGGATQLSIGVGAGVIVDGTTDVVQFTVQGHSTQTTLPFVVENSAGTDVFTVNNAGAIAGNGGVTINGQSLIFTDTNVAIAESGTNDLALTADGGVEVTITGTASTFGGNVSATNLIANAAGSAVIFGGGSFPQINSNSGSSSLHGTVGSGGVGFAIGGTICSVSTAVGNVGAGEDDLQTCTVAANALTVTNRGIHWKAWGTGANNANAKTLTCYAGTQAVLTNAFTVSLAESWEVEGWFTRTGASTQDWKSTFLGNTGAAGAFVYDPELGTATQTETAAITFKCTGTAVADNDIVMEGFVVEAF